MLRVRLVLVVLLAGCQRELGGAASLYCRRIGQPDSGGVNPLVISRYLCFESREVCGAADCEGVPAPRWSCFTNEGPTSDPLLGVTSCLPNEEMCKANRFEASSPCRPADAVYCETIGHGLLCAASEADCVAAAALGKEVVGITGSACTRR